MSHAEVAHERLPVLGEQDVSRRQVPMHDTDRVQVGQRRQQRGHDRDRLARGELATGTKKLGQGATDDSLVEDQRQRAAADIDGAVPAEEVLVPDPVVDDDLLNRALQRRHDVLHRDDLEDTSATIPVADRAPLSASRIRAHLPRDHEPWHERRDRDSSPFGLKRSLTRPTMP